MIVSLDDIKAHLRIVGTDDDALLTLYQCAIEEHIQHLTGADYSTDDIPFAIKAATLLLIADLYEHRTAQVEDAMHDNKAVSLLIYPHRVWA